MRNPLLLLSFVLLLAACKGSKKTQSAGSTYLTGTKWSLVKIKDVMAVTAARPRILEIGLPDKKGNGSFHGNGGCNNFDGKYSSEKGAGKISFSQIASTKMSCGDDKQENDFLQALENVNSYVISGSILKFYTGGELTLTLEAISSIQ